MGVLVSGTVSVSEGSSPLPPLNKSTPLSHSQLIVLISAVVGAATKSVCLKLTIILLGKGTEIITLLLHKGDSTIFRWSVAHSERALLPLPT